VHRFPIFGGYHLDRIPGTAIEKRTVWSFADAFLTSNAKIRVNFDAAKRRMIFIGHPKHARFDRTIFNARGRAGAAGTTVGCDRQNARLLLSRSFAIAF
jgi:hypothetical protein